LFRSVLEGVFTALPDSRLLVFDYADGRRDDSTVLSSGAEFRFSRMGARGGWRYHKPENLGTMAAFSQLGRTLGALHPAVNALDRCDAILDVSGGDSFSDIYGSRRFGIVVRPKLIAKRRGIPLVLLPQTYGPFRSVRKRELARQAVLGARMAWARDSRSFEALKDLLGPDFDEERHKESVDMAFVLPAADPGGKVSDEIREWLADRENHPVLGLNVSGLIALDAAEAKTRFGFRADYVLALLRFIEKVMVQPDLRLILIPHVMTPPGAPESDTEACLKIAKSLPSELRSRVLVSSRSFDEREVKWLISQMDWFCGTRMHSTIAALSSRVPSAAVAYSDKTLGVFESCQVGDQVIDPRALSTDDVVGRLLESFAGREETRRILSTSIDTAKARAAEQFHCTVRLLEEVA